MMELVHTFWFAECGQDLIEYSLLLAFVALIVVAFMMSIGGNVTCVWDEGSEVLHSAKKQAS